MQAGEQALDVGREVERVRDDDVVERAGQREFLAGLDVEVGVGQAGAASITPCDPRVTMPACPSPPASSRSFDAAIRESSSGTT